MGRVRRDWRGWVLDLGIVAFFVALPVAFFSTTAALVLFVAFGCASVIGTMRRRE